MTTSTNTPDELTMTIELPRLIVWFMLVPLALGLLIGLLTLFSGDFTEGLLLIIILGGLGSVGYYVLTQRTHLHLHRLAGRVTIQRVTALETTEREYPLEHLDCAEVESTRRYDSGPGGGVSRPTSNVQLVFRHTSPATRIPLTRWSVSGGGSGELANTINDWLRQARESAAKNPSQRT